MSCFELDGAEGADRGAAPSRVVEGLDALEDRRGELGSGLPVVAVEELKAERAEEDVKSLLRLTITGPIRRALVW